MRPNSTVRHYTLALQLPCQMCALMGGAIACTRRMHTLWMRLAASPHTVAGCHGGRCTTPTHLKRPRFLQGPPPAAILLGVA